MPTTTNHKVFCAFGAYVVKVNNPKAIEVVPIASGYFVAGAPPPPGTPVALDFTKRLGVANWDDVILDDVGLEPDGSLKSREYRIKRDDHGSGINVLTIGPEFPGPQWGGIYLEHSVFYKKVYAELQNQRPNWPADGRHPYEHMSSAALDGAKVLRYHGFHATVRGGSGP